MHRHHSIKARTQVTGAFVKQPIVSVSSGKPVAYELLSRLQAVGELAPRQLARLLDALDDPDTLAAWLGRAISQIEPDDACYLTLNIAARHWQAVLNTLRTHHAGDPRLRWMCLELIDAPHQPKVSIQQSTLQAFRALEVQLALDDLGGSVAQVNHFLEWPIDWIKLDASLLSPTLNRSKVDHWVQHLVGFSDAMGMRLVIEGIETEAQMVRFRRLGVDWQQGFYFGRPH